MSMELLAYVLAFFGLIVLINGVKPTMKRIEQSTDKELAKGVGFIAVILSIGFYIYIAISYLLAY